MLFVYVKITSSQCKVRTVVVDKFSYLRQVNEVNGGDNVFVRCV